MMTKRYHFFYTVSLRHRGALETSRGHLTSVYYKWNCLIFLLASEQYKNDRNIKVNASTAYGKSLFSSNNLLHWPVEMSTILQNCNFRCYKLQFPSLLNLLLQLCKFVWQSRLVYPLNCWHCENAKE